jgi:all-trans-retinol dehydrogenase (NAD+)
MRTLTGKHAVITGGAGGIGFATAQALLDEGCSVSLWDADGNALARAAETLRAHRMHTVTVDITDPRGVAEAREESEERLGPVDLLVNSAGYVDGGRFDAKKLEEAHREVDINVNGLINATHAILPGMLERNRGHVVNIASAAATLGVPGLSVYAATKWAVWGFTESLRHEAWKAGTRGVRFSTVHPNFIARGMFAGAGIPRLGGVLVPVLEDHGIVARAIVERALKRGRHSVKIPRSVRLAVILRALLPDGLFQRVVRSLGIHRSMDSWIGHER